MNKTATNGLTNPAAFRMEDLEAAVEKLRGLPPAKWLLVAPDGRMWSDTEPMKLARVLAAHALKIDFLQPIKL